MDKPQPGSSLLFLQGGGDMGNLMRKLDWSKTPLGAPEGWPAQLRQLTATMLQVPGQMMICWGSEYIQLYNDAFRPILGKNKHPFALGISVRETYAEVWPTLEPLFTGVMQGNPVTFNDFRLLIDRNGYEEEVFFDFSYSPIRNEEGKTEGVLVICTETTGKVKAMSALKESKDQLQFAINAAELGTWELNPATNTFRGNDRLKEWFGLKPQEEIELSVAIGVIAEKDRSKVNAAIMRALTYESGGYYDIEYSIQNPLTHKEIIVKAKGKAYFNDQGMPYTFSGTLQDVTEEAIAKRQLAIELKEQKLIREKVEASEARFRSLIEDAPVAMSVSRGRDCVVEIANERMFAIWGKNPEAVLGRAIFDAMPEARGQGFEEIIDAIFDTGEPFKASEISITLNRNGKPELIYLNLVYQPLLDHNNHVTGIMQVAIEVTEGVLSRKRIEESEAHLQLLRDTVPAMIFYVDLEERYRSYNVVFMDWFGVNATEAIGKTIREFLGEEAYQNAAPYLAKAYAGEHVEYFISAPQRIGNEKWLSIVYTPHRNKDEKVIGLIVHATDITEHVLARQLIEAKEKELRGLIAASPVGICVLRGIEARIEEVNERFIIISGKKREQFVNATYWDVFPEVAEAFAPILESVFKTGIKFTAEEAELVLIRHGVPETMFATFEYIPVFDTNNSVAKVIVMVVEVTQQVETRKRIEDAVIERTEELAASNLNLIRSNAELEQFAYIASHDLQEPVRKISTFTQMLEHSLGQISPKSKDYFAKIYSSAERMTNLIRDVLAFSQVSQDTDAFEKVDLHKLIRAITVDFELAIEQKHAAVVTHDLPVIAANPSQMTQLFSNLLSNSLKYTRPGIDPIIHISASLALKETIAQHPQLSSDKVYYKIDFSDNGIGFKQEYADRIFKIFQRLHAKNEFEGTGIGLSICRKIVQSHSGDISASPNADGGATFHILLPES